MRGPVRGLSNGHSSFFPDWPNGGDDGHLLGQFLKQLVEVEIEIGLDRRRLREAVKDGNIRIETHGRVTGQINGLTVVELGSYSFGHPSRITARVFVGRHGVLDIEREVELAGPIHTKGVLILQGLLGDRFGRHSPLRLGGTLVMEQNYSDVEGDSATLAESLALLSALSGLPVRLPPPSAEICVSARSRSSRSSNS